MLKAIANIMSRVGRGARTPSPAASRAPHGRGARGGRRMVVAKFDSAQTTPDNRKHWANADGLAPNAAANPSVRTILRNRARYEVANNSYAKGIVLTLANDTIGTGPRLQMLTEDEEANSRIEEAFARWAKAVDLPGKLRTMRMARAESGEAFGLLVSNPVIDSPVSLDVRLIEPDQVTSPWFGAPKANEVDGVVLDDAGNVASYRVLRRHPGENLFWRTPSVDPAAYDELPATSVVHYFRPDRPGQVRGIPDITPALPLFAQLRRFTLAVIAAAETAANFAAVIYTDSPPNGEADPLEPMDEVQLEQRLATVLPGGWKLGQVQAEHPSTTYAEFKHEILNEIARCLNMPFNVAAGNSSGYNYASGRLDHQTYYKSIRVEQLHLQSVVLDRILRAWLNEAVLVEGLLPQSMRQLGADIAHAPHTWFWDGVEHVDPAKEASAQATRLANHTTTLAAEFARQGRDWEQELRQRAKEQALMNELGLTPAPIPGAPATTPSPSGDPEDPSEEEVTNAHPDRRRQAA